MKLSFKTILPIILISALLILLAGCFGVTPEPKYTPGTITGIIAAPCCSTSVEPVSEPCCVSPEYWCYYCEKEWKLQDGVEVVLTYGEDEVATTITNENGEYTFTDVPPGKNYVITAYCPDYDDDRPLVKNVAFELVEGGSFDTKITDIVSTSLGLVVDFLVDFTILGPEDIVLDDVIADKPDFPNFPKFEKLIQEVLRVLEACQDVNTDVSLQYALCRAAEEISDLTIGCNPGYTPPPSINPCAGNNAPVITEVKINDTSYSSGSTIHVIVGNSYKAGVSATDDGIRQALTYSYSFNGTTIDMGTSSSYEGTPFESGDEGTYAAVLNVSDGCVTRSWTATVIVHDECYDNQGPTISINDKTIDAGDLLSYQPGDTGYSASDDNITGAPTFSLSNEPTDMIIDTATGEITWTAACGDGGLYEDIEVTITDACGETAVDTFDLTVVECCNPCIPEDWSATVTVEKWWWEDVNGRSGARADIAGTVNPPVCLTGDIIITIRLEVFTQGWGYKGTSGEVSLTLPFDNPFEKTLGFGIDVDNASYNSVKKYKLMIKPAGCSDWIEIDSGGVSVKAGY